MSVNVNSIKKVVELATKSRDDAGHRLGNAMGDLNAARAQLEQLSCFAAEGQEKWFQRASAGVSGALVQHQQAFSNKLEFAREFQVRVINNKEAAVEQARQQLQAAEQRLAVMKLVKERRLAEIAKKAARQEQKVMDEMSTAMLTTRRTRTWERSTV